MMTNDQCGIIRSGIEGKIDDLDKRLQIITNNINTRNELLITANMDVMKTSVNGIHSILNDIKEKLVSYSTLVDEHSDILHNADIHNAKLDNKIKEVFDTISHIQGCLLRITDIEKRLISGDYDMTKSSNDIKDILGMIDEMKTEITGINSVLIKNNINELPNLLNAYKKVLKYKYIIMGIGIVIILAISQGGIPVAAILHLIGL